MGDTGVIQFGRYELLERLGSGGMAEVYRARYPAAPGVSKSVVIKRVLGHFAANPTFAEMFLDEARICVGLSHGNIVQVFDFGQVEDEYFLAMEWVDGQPLSLVLKRSKEKGLPWLPAPIAVGIAIDLCRGLHYAHTLRDEHDEPLGLVHRDVSPDNILLSYEGETKLSDFGIAKARMAGRVNTEAGVVKGKFQYFSPEQARGEEVDARSDVYAVGVVLFQMLCGQRPTSGTELEVMFQAQQGRLIAARTLNPSLDEALVEILQRALMASRDTRYRSAEALQQSLSDWLGTNAPRFPTHLRKHLVRWLFQEELSTRKRFVEPPPVFLTHLESWRVRAASEPSEERPTTPDLDALPSSLRATQPVAALPEERPGLQEMPAQVDVPFPPPKRREPAPPPSPTPTEPPWRRPITQLTVLVGLVMIGVFLVMMERAPRPRIIQLTSTPSGAEVYLNGVRSGLTPMPFSTEAQGGVWHIELRLEGHERWETSFSRHSNVTSLSARLVPLVPLPPKRRSQGTGD
ncbi:serine/threonine-protein kinase [Myxococcus fulvus]|uniref:serine/threonine-protein kinase n=1 Tax=Myxococcus fulvus TaxID=33 RepID=UPI003B9B2E1B